MMVPTLCDSPGFPINVSIEDVFYQNTEFHHVEGLFQVTGTHVDSITLVDQMHDGFHVGKDGIIARHLLAIRCLELVGCIPRFCRMGCMYTVQHKEFITFARVDTSDMP